MYLSKLPVQYSQSPEGDPVNLLSLGFSGLGCVGNQACLNGGTCGVVSGVPQCFCPTGVTGTYCQSKCIYHTPVHEQTMNSIRNPYRW